MAKIAVIIDDLFEDVEYREPAKRFRDDGHSVVHVGLQAGRTVTGKKNGTQVKIDKAVDEVSVEDFDALLTPASPAIAWATMLELIDPELDPFEGGGGGEWTGARRTGWRR